MLEPLRLQQDDQTFHAYGKADRRREDLHAVVAARRSARRLFAAGDDVYHFQAGRSLAYLGNILEILACVDPGRRLDMQALRSALLPEAPRLSAVILVMMDWDRERASLVQLLKSHGLAVRVISMRHGCQLDGLEPSEIVEVPV